MNLTFCFFVPTMLLRVLMGDWWLTLASKAVKPLLWRPVLKSELHAELLALFNSCSCFAHSDGLSTLDMGTGKRVQTRRFAAVESDLIPSSFEYIAFAVQVTHVLTTFSKHRDAHPLLGDP